MGPMKACVLVTLPCLVACGTEYKGGNHHPVDLPPLAIDSASPRESPATSAAPSAGHALDRPLLGPAPGASSPITAPSDGEVQGVWRTADRSVSLDLRAGQVGTYTRNGKTSEVTWSRDPGASRWYLRVASTGGQLCGKWVGSETLVLTELAAAAGGVACDRSDLTYTHTLIKP